MVSTGFAPSSSMVPPVLGSGQPPSTGSMAASPTELTRRMTALAPRIAELADEAERLRRPTDEAWCALRRAGYFHQFTPVAFGGMASDLDSFIDATLPIAEACPPTAWAASFCAAHNRNLANYPEAVQEEIWGGGRGHVVAPQLSPATPPALARAVEGGVRLSGRWTWATGVMHAEWVFAVAVESTAGAPRMVMALFPADAARILDTWHVDGMAGTGSQDVEVEDLFVPEDRVLRDLGMLSGNGLASRLYPEAAYRVPLTTFSAIIAAVPILGAARRLATLFREVASRRTIKGGGDRQADRPSAQIRLARADVMVKTAETSLREVARAAGGWAALPPAENVAARITARARTAFVVDLCLRSSRMLADGAGSSVHRLADPFQRIVRDVALASTHVGFETDGSYELHGRSLFGLEPNSFIF